MASKQRKAIDLGLDNYEELFMNEQERKENRLPRIYDIPLSEIDEFPDHPFQVRMDEDMDQLVESIKERGVITPVTLRRKEDDRYETVSGHRRIKACALAGLETVPAEIKELTRDEAIILMVDSNLQRSEIKPSEKAFAYKMRLEAQKRQGFKADLTSSPVATKLKGSRSDKELGILVGESKDQMFREVADVQTADMLKLPVPDVEYHNEVIKPSDFQRDMVKSFADRAEKVRSGMVEATEDNMLKITNDGRKLALDQRLQDEMLPDDPDSKVNACVENIHRICPYCTNHKLLPGFNDFASSHPDLAKEWSDRNLPVTPDSIAEKKEGVFWWRCAECGGEYQAWLYSRIMGSRCPFCSNRLIQQGNNDLATTDPLIAAEWMATLNGGIKPADVSRTSHKAYWWKGKCGHTYKAKISDRTIFHTPCPVCEDELYAALPTLLVMLYAKRRDTPLQMNNSKLIGIPVEMYLPEQKVVIEREAPTLLQFKEQLVKEQLLAKRGIRFLTMVSHEMPLDMAAEVQRTLAKCALFIRTDLHDDVRFVAQQFLKEKSKCKS